MGHNPIDDISASFPAALQELHIPDINQSRILVALSGGLDSVVLLHLFRNTALHLHNNLYAAYIHHNLRPEASGEQEFCDRLCQEWQIPFRTASVFPDSLADARSLSLEEAARTLRYQALEDIRAELGADYIATAHHQDDLAETLLWKIFRGTGLDGLAGPRRRRGNLIRPLLDFSRASLAEYARIHRLDWKEDSSNQDLSFDRNYIRHQLLPVILERFPAASRKMAELAVQAERESSDWQYRIDQLMEVLRPEKDCLVLPLSLRPQYSQALWYRVMVRFLQRLEQRGARLRTAELERIWAAWTKGDGSRILWQNSSVQVRFEYGDLCLCRNPENFPCKEIYVKLIPDKSAAWGTYLLHFSRCDAPLKDKDSLCIRTLEQVTVRSWAQGDRMEYKPGYFKKIQDLLVDAKIPGRLRMRSIIIEDHGTVAGILIPGYYSRCAAPFYIQDGDSGIKIRAQDTGRLSGDTTSDHTAADS